MGKLATISNSPEPQTSARVVLNALVQLVGIWILVDVLLFVCTLLGPIDPAVFSSTLLGVTFAQTVAAALWLTSGQGSFAQRALVAAGYITFVCLAVRVGNSLANDQEFASQRQTMIASFSILVIAQLACSSCLFLVFSAFGIRFQRHSPDSDKSPNLSIAGLFQLITAAALLLMVGKMNYFNQLQPADITALLQLSGVIVMSCSIIGLLVATAAIFPQPLIAYSVVIGAAIVLIDGILWISIGPDFGMTILLDFIMLLPMLLIAHAIEFLRWQGIELRRRRTPTLPPLVEAT